MHRLILCAALAGLFAMPAARAQHAQHDKGSMTPASAPAAATSAAAGKDLMASMETMGKAMAAAPMTGNVDQDFVAMMIPHHQGAIDMCAVVLKYGTDPIIRKLCRGIVANQTKEIAMMQHWQRRYAPAH